MLLVGVFFVCLSVVVFFFSSSMQSVIRGVARPLWYVRDSVVSHVISVGNYFVFKGTLIKKNTELTDTITALELKVQDYDTLAKENQELKSLYGGGATSTLSSHRISARVISKPPYSPFDTFVLDAGSGEGLVVGARVYVSDTVLIGLVTDVTSHTSLVTLFSSNSQKVRTELSRTGMMYELSGSGGANMTLTVPKDTDIVWGDVFMYSGKYASTIGSVFYIDETSQGSFKTVYIRMPQNVFSSKWVMIEK